MVLLKHILVLPFVLLAGTIDASGVKAPAGYYQTLETKEKSEYVCMPVPQAFTGELIFKSKYTGDHSGSRSKINKAAYDSYKDAITDTRALEKLAHEYAKDFIKGYAQQARNCYFDALDEWAKNDALLQKKTNQVGEAVRKWTLASIASVYLQMHLIDAELEKADRQKTARIELWMRKLALEVISFYSDREPRKINNHDYWAGYAVAITSVILQDENMFRWSMGKFNEGLARVRPTGFMEHEIKRGHLALKYQNYAIQPLVMLAGYAHANNAITQQQIDRLALAINTLASGIENPKIFERATGIAQETKDLRKGWSLAWIPVWEYYFDTTVTHGLSDIAQGPFKSKRLGGDMTWLFPDRKKSVNHLKLIGQYVGG